MFAMKAALVSLSFHLPAHKRILLVLCLIFPVFSQARAIGGEVAGFEVRLVQNDAPSPTLFLCKVAVSESEVSLRSSGFKNTLMEMIWERDHAAAQTFTDHSLKLEDKQLTQDFITIAKHFELCQEGSDLMCVSGGVITKIECIADKDSAPKKAHYIALDSSRRRATAMEYLCGDLQMLAVSDVLHNDDGVTKARESLKTRAGKLAADMRSYMEAIGLLEAAFKEDQQVDWSRITKLVCFRPDQAPLQRRSRLVKTTHAVLSESCSKAGLQHILGPALAQTGAVVLRIGPATRCRGSFSIPENPDWGFDDVETCLGLTFPPDHPAVPVGVIDVGVERLVLNFLLRDAPEAATAYDRFSLTLTGNSWDVVHRWSFKHDPIPEKTRARIAFLTKTSGLLQFLLGGRPPAQVVFLEIDAVVIEDDNWNAARLDYRLGNQAWVLPLFWTNEKWRSNRPWNEQAYRDLGNVIENDAFFRSRNEVEQHNAEPADPAQPPTKPADKAPVKDQSPPPTSKDGAQ